MPANNLHFDHTFQSLYSVHSIFLARFLGFIIIQYLLHIPKIWSKGINGPKAVSLLDLLFVHNWSFDIYASNGVKQT